MTLTHVRNIIKFTETFTKELPLYIIEANQKLEEELQNTIGSDYDDKPSRKTKISKGTMFSSFLKPLSLGPLFNSVSASKKKYNLSKKYNNDKIYNLLNQNDNDEAVHKIWNLFIEKFSSKDKENPINVIYLDKIFFY